MDGAEENTRPGFMQGNEVACSKRYAQPGFDGQLPLEREKGLKKKLMVALIVISSVFLGGMIAGAVVRLFV